jgi:hypothetical protein
MEAWKHGSIKRLFHWLSETEPDVLMKLQNRTSLNKEPRYSFNCWVKYIKHLVICNNIAALKKILTQTGARG